MDWKKGLSPMDAKKGDKCTNDLQVAYDDGTRQNLADTLSSLPQVEGQLAKWNNKCMYSPTTNPHGCMLMAS